MRAEFGQDKESQTVSNVNIFLLIILKLPTLISVMNLEKSIL